MSDTNTDKKPEFPGRFDRDIIGVIKTCNVNEWGIRGILTTESGEEIIYVITFDKIPKEKIPLLSKGDKVHFSDLYVTTYIGNVKKWQGKEQGKLCKNGFVKIITKAVAPETTKPETPTEALVTNVQLFTVLQKNVRDAIEALEEIEKYASLKESVPINHKDFHRLTNKAQLAYHRAFSTINHILIDEE